jgi:hypothetical protein
MITHTTEMHVQKGLGVKLGLCESRIMNSSRYLLDFLSSRLSLSLLAFSSLPSSPTACRALFSTELSPGENVVVPLIAQSLEWALSSPPPLHQFEEPPLVVETDHLDLHPGKEVEEVLAAQGQEVTDIIGKEKWVLNDPAKYEGLIPQNEDWTEFVDEKTGEWVYLDEYGEKISK